MGEITGWESLSWHWTMLSWVGLTSPMHPNLHSFTPILCWNFSIGNLDFPKSSLVCGWLFKTVFSRDSQTIAKRGWSWFIGHCSVCHQDQGLYAYYPTHGWARHQAFWCMVLYPVAPTNALLFVDGCQIIIVERWIQMRDLLFSHVAEVTLKSCSWLQSQLKLSGPEFNFIRKKYFSVSL